jgi:putative membrane protein
MSHSNIVLAASVVGLVMGIAACGGTNEQSQPSSRVGMSDPQRFGAANQQPPSPPPVDTSEQNAPAATSPFPSSAPPSPSNSSGQSTATWGQGETMTAPGTGNSGASGAAMDVSGFNDGQIAAVLHSLVSGEIQQAQLAETKATSTEVKQFARKLAADHGSFDTKTTSTLKKANISLSENAISQQLSSDAQKQQSTLQGEAGRDFDRDYIDAQVKGHVMALDLVDKMILKSTDASLRSLLQDFRAKMEAQMKDAERIQDAGQKRTTGKPQSPSSPPRIP